MNVYLENIPYQWRFTQGKNTNIAIIDAGFDVNNIYLKNHIKQYKDYGFTDIDHGSHVMGIMCLATSKNIAVKGFANRANYYLVSVPIGKAGASELIADGLQWLYQFNIDVINMSFTCYSENLRVKYMLNRFDEKNTILVASYSQQFLYPHVYSNVISAGKDLIVKDNFLSTVSNNQFKNISGTSMQSAFITSVVSIAKSYDKKINKNSFLNKVAGSKIFSVDNGFSKQIDIKL